MIIKKIKILSLIVLGISIFCFNIFNVQEVIAATSTTSTDPGPQVKKLYFRPNIEIPGMKEFFPGLFMPDPDPKHPGVTLYEIDEYSIARYVSAVYSYAAILAGVIAMFMLVFAAYQWLRTS